MAPLRAIDTQGVVLEFPLVRGITENLYDQLLQAIDATADELDAGDPAINDILNGELQLIKPRLRKVLNSQFGKAMRAARSVEKTLPQVLDAIETSIVAARVAKVEQTIVKKLEKKFEQFLEEEDHKEEGGKAKE